MISPPHLAPLPPPSFFFFFFFFYFDGLACLACSLSELSELWSYGQLVGLLGRGISPSQGR
jgi:hypothetical protein